MSFWERPKAYDPQEPANRAKAGLASQYGTEYNNALNSPSWGLPDPQMVQWLENKTSQDVRARNPQAASSAWLDDQVASKLLELRLGLVDKRRQALDKLRDAQVQLTSGISSNVQPGQPSTLEAMGSRIMGGAADRFGAGMIDKIFGFGKNDEKPQTQSAGGVNIGRQPWQPGAPESDAVGV